MLSLVASCVVTELAEAISEKSTSICSLFWFTIVSFWLTSFQEADFTPAPNTSTSVADFATLIQPVDVSK